MKDNDLLVTATGIENDPESHSEPSIKNQAEKESPVGARQNDEAVTLENLESFKCNECLKSLSSEFMLAFHMKIYHEETSCFTCDLCDKTFREFRLMINHMKACHSSLPPNDENANLEDHCQTAATNTD